MNVIYLKNRFIPAEQASISLDDRSFRFGDGVFETILVVEGKMYDFPSHRERLESGLKFFDLALDTRELEKCCAEIILRNNLMAGYVRLVVSRGENRSGAVGYLPGDAEPYLAIQTIEKSFPAFQTLKLWVSSCRAFYGLPCKVNSALHYVVAMQEARKRGCDNALLLDREGYICETASGNLFWFAGDTLYTPSADLALVPGTVRRRILELWPGRKEQGRFKLDALKDAEEIFMTNIGGLVSAVSDIEPAAIHISDTKKTREARHLIESHILTRCS